RGGEQNLFSRLFTTRASLLYASMFRPCLSARGKAIFTLMRVDSPTTWSAYYRVIYATNLYRRYLTGCSVCCRRSSDCPRLASLAARDAAIVPAKVERRIVDRWATCTTSCHPGSVRLLFAHLS